MPASIAATSSRDRGCVMSIPDTSPANVGVICRMVAGTVLSSRLSFGGAGFLFRCHRRAAHGGAPHIAHLSVVEPSHAVHDLTIVPHHQVPLSPFVRIDELRLRCVLHQIADEGARLGYRPADDGTNVCSQEQ